MEASGKDAPTNDVATDTSTGTFCQSLSPAPDFCDDFEFDDAGLSPPWTRLQTGGGSTMDPSLAHALSAPVSLKMHAQASGTCGSYATLERDFGAFSDARLAFDVYQPAAGDGLVAGFYVGGTYRMEVDLGETAYVQQNDPTGIFDYFDAGLTAGSWSHVEIHVALGADGGTSGIVEISLGGTVMQTSAITATDATGSATFFIGDNCYNNTPSRELYFDNVTLYYH